MTVAPDPDAAPPPTIEHFQDMQPTHPSFDWVYDYYMAMKEDLTINPGSANFAGPPRLIPENPNMFEVHVEDHQPENDPPQSMATTSLADDQSQPTMTVSGTSPGGTCIDELALGMEVSVGPEGSPIPQADDSGTFTTLKTSDTCGLSRRDESSVPGYSGSKDGIEGGGPWPLVEVSSSSLTESASGTSADDESRDPSFVPEPTTSTESITSTPCRVKTPGTSTIYIKQIYYDHSHMH